MTLSSVSFSLAASRVFVSSFGDLVDHRNVIDLVDVHGQVAIVDAAGC